MRCFPPVAACKICGAKNDESAFALAPTAQPLSRWVAQTLSRPSRQSAIRKARLTETGKHERRSTVRDTLLGLCICQALEGVLNIWQKQRGWCEYESNVPTVFSIKEVKTVYVCYSNVKDFKTHTWDFIKLDFGQWTEVFPRKSNKRTSSNSVHFNHLLGVGLFFSRQLSRSCAILIQLVQCCRLYLYWLYKYPNLM